MYIRDYSLNSLFERMKSYSFEKNDMLPFSSPRYCPLYLLRRSWLAKRLAWKKTLNDHANVQWLSYISY